MPASLIVTCIGYQTPRIEGVPYDERGGKFANDQGKIADGLYAVGWARRGPTGTIGTNRPDGYEVAEQVAAAMPPGSDGGKAGGAGLDALLTERGVEATSFDDWRAIEAAEVAAARAGSPREKFVRHERLAENARRDRIDASRLRIADPPARRPSPCTGRHASGSPVGE